MGEPKRSWDVEPTVLSNRRLAAIYLIGAVALSSVSISFEWLSPIETPEGPWNWYGEVGIRRGGIVVGTHAPPGGGWQLDLHWPRISPVPMFAGAGPENGGLYVSVAFFVGAIAVVHLVARVLRD